jgi:hypothetical protein
MRRPLTLTATGLVLVASVALGATTSASGTTAPKASPKTIGYIYAGTIPSGIETLAVHADYTLSLVHTTPSPSQAISGMALLHTDSGLKLYVDAGPFGQLSSIYTYSVSATTGALTKSTAKPAGPLAYPNGGNNLFAWDGRAHKATDADAIYALTCIATNCSTYGLGVYKVNQKTGAPTLAGPPRAAQINEMSGYGDRIDLEGSDSGPYVVPIKIDDASGLLTTGARDTIETLDKPPVPEGLRALVTGPTSVAGQTYLGATAGEVIDVLGSVPLQILHGSATPALINASTGMFFPHLLLMGGTNGTGPKLQLVLPDGSLSDGTIDLTKPPYNLTSGSGTDPYGVETIYRLGKGVYIGNYINPIVQGTYGVGGKNLELNQKHPIIPNSGDVTSMAGFLFPAATHTTATLHRKGTKLMVSGAVSGGHKGVHVTVKLLVKKGTHYVPDAKKTPALTATHRYSATFGAPNAARCEVTVNYPGTTSTSASNATLHFAC